MKVLVITGDRRFGPGHSRYELQRSAVKRLAVLYWGRGNLWPGTLQEHFDVVTAQDPFWRGAVGWLIARRIGAKFNVQVHTDLSAQSFLRHALAQAVLRHADSVRVVSLKIKDQVIKMGISAPISILPIYIETERFRAVRREPSQQKAILWFGRFEEEKDPLLALEVLKQVPRARLTMLGAGSLEKELKAKAKDLPIEFPGWQDPLPYLAQAEVVLCTSKHESYGASIIEALAAGVPVVAPDVGVAREAGAIVVAREKLAGAVIETLQSSPRAELKLTLLSKDAWAAHWRKTLI